MGEVRYMISEAAKRINMETHVLRHWEEELGLTIGRTEMGHRYYTDEDLRLFNCIKKLKEQGMLLKELKELIPDMLRTKAELKKKKEPVTTEVNPEKPELTEFQLALLENNKVLEEAITQSVIQEMGYLFITQEQQEEERYKKLDYLIRQHQSNNKQYTRSTPLKQLRRIFEG